MHLALLSLIFAMTVASGASAASTPVAVSLSHFNHLYADLDIGGKQMGVVHIYAKFPTYAYGIEPREGYACVDDVARAIGMLAHAWRRHRDPELLRKIRRLTEFVLHLQNGNGYFNNFIWNDKSINTSYRTSVAELNWWSLRALLGLEQAYAVLKDEPAMAGRIRAAADRLVHNIERDLHGLPHVNATEAGVTVPSWLPAGSGGDQAALAIIALLPHYRRTGKPGVRRIVASLADGLLLMQKGDAGAYPYGMYLSWRNTWHAWGNDQAYAMLLAGEALDRKDYVASALKEVDNFYPYLLKNGFAESIQIRADNGVYREVSRNAYPQIAYGVRPMIFASLKAHALTKDAKYKTLAAELGTWLTGRNDAGMPMYDPATGIVFDGIVARAQVNRDSGAESTIEALLALQALKDGVR